MSNRTDEKDAPLSPPAVEAAPAPFKDSLIGAAMEPWELTEADAVVMRRVMDPADPTGKPTRPSRAATVRLAPAGTPEAPDLHAGITNLPVPNYDWMRVYSSSQVRSVYEDAIAAAAKVVATIGDATAAKLRDAEGELTRLREATRWRDVREEPLPTDDNAAIEVWSSPAKNDYLGRDYCRVSWAHRFISGEYFWRPLTPGPTESSVPPVTRAAEPGAPQWYTHRRWVKRDAADPIQWCLEVSGDAVTTHTARGERYCHPGSAWSIQSYIDSGDYVPITAAQASALLAGDATPADVGTAADDSMEAQ